MANGLWFADYGFGIKFQLLGVRFQSKGLRVRGLWSGVSGLVIRVVYGSGFGVEGLGLTPSLVWG